MFIFIACISLLSLSQIHADVTHPTLGPVYVSATNSSSLNFTFIYPSVFQFDNLYITFTIYDFINNEKSNPQPYIFQWLNFTSSNSSLPWAAPDTALIPGDYVIGCFRWVRTFNNNSILDDTRECILTRAPINSTIPPIDQMNITTSLVTNDTITIDVYYPQSLPYDMVNITSNINGVITPATTNANSNGTFMNIITYSFTKLMERTQYNACIYTDYANSKENATHHLDTNCYSITTLSSNTSYKMISYTMIIISMIIVAFI